MSDFPESSKWRMMTPEDVIPFGRRAYVWNDDGDEPDESYYVWSIVVDVCPNLARPFLSTGGVSSFKHAAVLKSDDPWFEGLKRVVTKKMEQQSIESQIIEALSQLKNELEMVWVDATEDHVGMKCRCRDGEGHRWLGSEEAKLFAVVESEWAFVVAINPEDAPVGYRYCQVQVPRKETQ